MGVPARFHCNIPFIKASPEFRLPVTVQGFCLDFKRNHNPFFPALPFCTMPELEPGRALFILALVGITIVVAILLNGGGSTGGSGNVTGTLTGNVSIGPLCPVEPCTVSRDRLVAAYASHPILISTSGGTAVTTVIADPDTGYSVSLKPGTYTVDIARQGVGGSRDLPATVTLRNGETVWLNISIDTGIR